MWDPDGCGRSSNAAVAVGAVRTDPPGDESQTPNEEWIEIISTGGPVDLTGWGVQDESSSHRFSFPAGFRLAAGAAVRIHTGCGANRATDLYWCVSGSAVWNNDGDTVYDLFGMDYCGGDVAGFVKRRAKQGFNLLRTRLHTSHFHQLLVLVVI